MKLIAKVITRYIVTDSSLISKTESLTNLLTDHYTGCKLSRAIALSELIRVSISLDCSTEFFNGIKIEILYVISVDRCSFGTGRALCDSSNTIPSNSLRISSRSILYIKSTVLYASFIKSLTSFVPYKWFKISHNLFPP